MIIPPHPLARLTISFLAGLLSILAYAPFGLWPLQIASVAVLIALVTRAPSIKLTFFLGWSYGTGWILGGIYWLYISMHHFGGMPGWLAALAVLLLSMFLGAHTALAMAGASWLSRSRHMTPAVSLLLVFPAAWAVMEWVRSWIFTGFPWVSTGYAHVDSPLGGFAPVVGVYGVGLVAAVVAGAVVLLETRRWAVAVGAAVFAIGFGLQSVTWTQASGQPISVRLLQGNVAQNLKFDADQAGVTLKLYQDMIRATPADLIATPETALPLMAHQLPAGYIESLMDHARQSNSHLMIGVPISDGPRQYVNSMIGLSPNIDAKVYRYDKHHLVPFGEFIPLGFRWFVDTMNIPLGDFTRGAYVQPPFAVRDQWVLPNVCYEDLFGEEIADQIRANATRAMEPTIMLNTSNIAWFGDSLALPQHLQSSQMRALEMRRPMLRATNTGATAVIDGRGRIVAQLAPFSFGTLAASVQGYKGSTPFILFGNALVIGLALAMLSTAWLLHRKTRRISPQPSETR